MADGQDFDTAEFADQLSAMTDEELFALMQKLEDESEDVRAFKNNIDNTAKNLCFY